MRFNSNHCGDCCRPRKAHATNVGMTNLNLMELGGLLVPDRLDCRLIARELDAT